MRFRKKPVEIEALLFTKESAKEVWKFCSAGELHLEPGCVARFVIPTLEGNMEAREGDWIIRGVKGEFYPCEPDIFEATYEVVR